MKKIFLAPLMLVLISLMWATVSVAWIGDSFARLRMVVDETQVVGTHTNMPLMYSAKISELTNVLPYGTCVRFTNAADDTLAHQVAVWDTINDHAEFYFLADTLSPQDRIFYMYWGDPAYTEMPTEGILWDDYALVLHYDQPPTQTTIWDESDTNNAVARGAWLRIHEVPGKIGNAWSYDSDRVLNVPDLNVTGDWYVSLWAQTDNPGIYGDNQTGSTDFVMQGSPCYWFMDIQGAPGSPLPQIRWRANNDNTSCEVGPSGHVTTQSRHSIDNQWNYYGFGWQDDPIIPYMWKNGEFDIQWMFINPEGDEDLWSCYWEGGGCAWPDSVDINLQGANQGPSTDPIGIGSTQWAGNYLDSMNGLIDEFRIRTSVPSTSWVQTEYNNMNDQSAFFADLAVEPLVDSVPEITRLFGQQTDQARTIQLRGINFGNSGGLVEIRGGQNYSTSTGAVVQGGVIWADEVIFFTIDMGTHLIGEDLYVYVTDAAGEVSNAFTLPFPKTGGKERDIPTIYDEETQLPQPTENEAGNPVSSVETNKAPTVYAITGQQTSDDQRTITLSGTGFGLRPITNEVWTGGSTGIQETANDEDIFIDLDDGGDNFWNRAGAEAGNTVRIDDSIGAWSGSKAIRASRVEPGHPDAGASYTNSPFIWTPDTRFKKVYLSTWVYVDPQKFNEHLTWTGQYNAQGDSVMSGSTQWKMIRFGGDYISGPISDAPGQMLFHSFFQDDGDLYNSSTYTHAVMSEYDNGKPLCVDTGLISQWTWAAWGFDHYEAPTYAQYRFGGTFDQDQAWLAHWGNGLGNLDGDSRDLTLRQNRTPLPRTWKRITTEIDIGESGEWDSSFRLDFSHPGLKTVTQVNGSGAQLGAWGLCSSDTDPALTGKIWDPWMQVAFQNFLSDSWTQDERIGLWYDDIAIQAGSFARVELGDAPIYEDCTIWNYQPVSSWTDTSIDVQYNRGNFPIDSNVWMFVIGDDGVASAGIQVPRYEAPTTERRIPGIYINTETPTNNTMPIEGDPIVGSLETGNTPTVYEIRGSQSTDEEQVAIIGSGFGSRVGAETVWTGGDDSWVESGTDGVSILGIQPDWTQAGLENSTDPIISTAFVWSDSQSIDASVDHQDSDSANTIFLWEPSTPFTDIHFTYWVHFTADVVSPTTNFAQWKRWRINGGSNPSKNMTDQTSGIMGSSAVSFSGSFYETHFFNFCEFGCDDAMWSSSCWEPLLFASEGNGTGSEYTNWEYTGGLSNTQERWAQFSVTILGGTVAGDDGYASQRYLVPSNGTHQSNSSSGVRFFTDAANCDEPGIEEWLRFGLQNYFDDNGQSYDVNEQASIYYDDIFVQTGSVARVEVGNSGVYEEATILEHQEIVSWSTTKIVIEFNNGSWDINEDLWVYVFDENDVLSNSAPLPKRVSATGCKGCPDIGEQ